MIVNKKGTKTFLDRNINYDDYTFSFELKNEMYHQINRLIEKYEVQDDQVAIDLVNILKGHRDDLGVTAPADPISYEDLMTYHLAFPPFFPNQKTFESDDDFFVRTQEKFDPAIQDTESIIDRRRAWFEEEMEQKRDRTIQIRYYDATGWNNLPPGGLAGLAHYDTGTAYSINYPNTFDEFAGSGKDSDVAALFSGYIYIDPVIKWLCVKSDDGSKVYLDNNLRIDNDGLHAPIRRCTEIEQGVFKIDVEYFESSGGAELILEFGPNKKNLRVVPPRSWASVRQTALVLQITSSLYLCCFLTFFPTCTTLLFSTEQEGGQRRYRELMRLNDLLEEDLKILKETDFMGPTTRAEFNRRKKLQATNKPTVTSEGRKLIKGALQDFSNFDEVRQLSKMEQLQLMRDVFGG